MKFIDEKGKLCEGTPITDEQAIQRERLIRYFHHEACEDAYHGSYGNRPCENLALAFLTGEIQKAADTPEAQSAPGGSIAAIAPGFASA